MSENSVVDTPQTKSIWSYLVSIIDKPQQTFTELTASPRGKWILPLLLALVVAIIAVWVTTPYSSELAQEASRRQMMDMGMSPEEMEDMLAQASRFTSPMFIGIVGTISTIIMMAVTWLLTAALLYFVSLVMGGETTFSPVFVVVAWASIPLTLRGIVQSILILVTGKFPLYTGLAALKVTGDPLVDSGNPMIAALSFADIFWIWHFILLVIGLAVAAKFSKLKAFFIVLLYGILSIGVGVGFSLLGQAGG